MTDKCRGYGKTTGTWQRCMKMSGVEGNDNRDVRKMGELRISQNKDEKSAKTAAVEEHTGLDKPPLLTQTLLVCHLIFSGVLQQQDVPDSSPALECK